MSRKHNRFFLFICSLLPGAGEMYLGFMKQGLSLMTLFFGMVSIIAFFRTEFLLFLMPVIWCYSFFHVHNLNALSDEAYAQVQDEYLIKIPENTSLEFGRCQKTLLALACICIGVYALMNALLNAFSPFIDSEFFYEMKYVISEFFPQLALSVLLIIMGIRLIRGKKLELDLEEEACTSQKKEDLSCFEEE